MWVQCTLIEQLNLGNKKSYYNRPNGRNKSTASFGKSELTIMSESKMMPSAYSDSGNHANQCMPVNIPKYQNQKAQKHRDREAKGNVGLLERHFLNLKIVK